MIIIKILHLKEAFATLVAKVGELVVVLFPVKDHGISVSELSSAIFTLVDLSHPVAERLLFEPMFFFYFWL